MFGIGMPELLLILAVALIVIGPKKLPDLAKSLGKAMGEFKRATNDLKQSLEQETGLEEVRQSFREADLEMKRSFESESLSKTGDGVPPDTDPAEPVPGSQTKSENGAAADDDPSDGKAGAQESPKDNGRS